MRSLRECAARGDDDTHPPPRAIGELVALEMIALQPRQERAGSTQAPDDPRAEVDDDRAHSEARARDATRLRRISQTVMQIDVPTGETRAGSMALASIRRWIVDVAAGARGHASALEDEG